MALSKCLHNKSSIAIGELIFSKLSQSSKSSFRNISTLTSNSKLELRKFGNHSIQRVVNRQVIQIQNFQRTLSVGSCANSSHSEVSKKSKDRRGMDSETESELGLVERSSAEKEKTSVTSQQSETPTVDFNPKPEDSQTVSLKSKLKQAVRDYGGTVIVFHVIISLSSLGFFYLLVSSGLDFSEIMKKIGVPESIVENRLTQGASTFVIAYAIHKIFAPARIVATLTCTPLIVRRLRAKGILKPKLP